MSSSAKKRAGGVDFAQSVVVAKRIDRLEQAFGKNPNGTLSSRERELVLEGVIPAWVFAGREGLRGELQERCRKAATVLEQLHDLVEPELRKLGQLPR
jgi:hypothetical protein